MLNFSRKIIDKWDIYEEQDPKLFVLQRTFYEYEDCIDVMFEAKKTDGGYLLKSSAECRTSGPAENTHGIFPTIDEVIRATEIKCMEWELRLSSDVKADMSQVEWLRNE